MTLIAPPPYEWAIAMAFYAAVHFVDAYLWEKGLGHAGEHQIRNGWVNTLSDLQRIALAYNQLYSDSRIARYRPMHPFTRGEVQTVFADMQYVGAEILKLL